MLPMCLSSPNAHVNIAHNKKGKYQEFCMGYSDKTWYVGSSGLKCYSCVLLLWMRILSTSYAYLF